MNRLISILTVLLLTTCQHEDNKKVSMLSQQFKKLPKEFAFDETKYILFVPSSGCKGCITNTESFITSHLIKTNKFKVIFSGIKSHKILINNVGSSIYYNKNVYIDSSNIFSEYNLFSYYPVLIEMKNGQISNLHEVSPDNPNILSTKLL